MLRTNREIKEYFKKYIFGYIFNPYSLWSCHRYLDRERL